MEQKAEKILKDLWDVYDDLGTQEFQYWLMKPDMVEHVMRAWSGIELAEFFSISENSGIIEIIYTLGDNYRLYLTYDSPNLLVEIRNPKGETVKFAKFSKACEIGGY